MKFLAVTYVKMHLVGDVPLATYPNIGVSWYLNLFTLYAYTAFFYCEIDGTSLCLQCDMIVHVGGKRTHGRYLLLRQRVEVKLLFLFYRISYLNKTSMQLNLKVALLFFIVSRR